MSDVVAEDDLRHCADVLQERDRLAWLATLLMPQPLRDATTILRAWHCELAAIPQVVSEPMAGEVRLQWWADVVAGGRADEASGHPLARALLALMAAHKLPPQTLDAKIAAHVFDLYADPMGPRSMFEGHAGETRSALYQLAGLCQAPGQVSESATASGHAGVAEMVAAVLRALPQHIARQRVYLPSDLLQSVGLDAAAFLAAGPDKRAAAVAAFADYGQEHLAKAKAAVSQIEQDGNGAHLAYLSLVATERALMAAQADPVGVQGEPLRVSTLRTQWAMWRAARAAVTTPPPVGPRFRRRAIDPRPPKPDR